MNLFSEAVAAWVQAIGSIVAIVAGFAVAIFQVRAARRDSRTREEQADRNARQAALALAALGLDCCRLVEQSLEAPGRAIDGAFLQQLKRQVEATRQMLASFPIASLKLRSLIEEFARLPGLIDSVADNLREAADTTLKGDPADPATLEKVRSRIRDLGGRAQAVCARLTEQVTQQDGPG